MSSSLAQATALYAFCLAVICGVRAVLGRAPGPAARAAFVVLAAAVALQAILSAIALVGGERPIDEPTAIGYLAAPLVIGGIVAPTAAAERSSWGTAMLGIAALAIAVVSVRLVAVWE